MESKETIRCRLKHGDVEFEIEGVANPDLTKKVDSLYEMFTEAVVTRRVAGETPTETKPERRGGGRRPPFIKNAILSIIKKEPQWFVDKSRDDVTDKLKTRYGVPGAKAKPVGTALIRLFADGKLTRRKVEGKYLYSVTTLKSE